MCQRSAVGGERMEMCIYCPLHWSLCPLVYTSLHKECYAQILFILDLQHLTIVILSLSLVIVNVHYVCTLLLVVFPSNCSFYPHSMGFRCAPCLSTVSSRSCHAREGELLAVAGRARETTARSLLGQDGTE